MRIKPRLFYSKSMLHTQSEGEATAKDLDAQAHIKWWLCKIVCLLPCYDLRYAYTNSIEHNAIVCFLFLLQGPRGEKGAQGETGEAGHKVSLVAVAGEGNCKEYTEWKREATKREGERREGLMPGGRGQGKDGDQKELPSQKFCSKKKVFRFWKLTVMLHCCCPTCAGLCWTQRTTRLPRIARTEGELLLERPVDARSRVGARRMREREGEGKKQRRVGKG